MTTQIQRLQQDRVQRALVEVRAQLKPALKAIAKMRPSMALRKLEALRNLLEGIQKS